MGDGFRLPNFSSILLIATMSVSRTGSGRSDFCRVAVPLVVVEGDDGGVLRHGPVAQLLLDQLPVLVLVPGVGGLEAALEVLKWRSRWLCSKHRYLI